jgi:hypothetical protein
MAEKKREDVYGHDDDSKCSCFFDFGSWVDLHVCGDEKSKIFAK